MTMEPTISLGGCTRSADIRFQLLYVQFKAICFVDLNSGSELSGSRTLGILAPARCCCCCVCGYSDCCYIHCCWIFGYIYIYICTAYRHLRLLAAFICLHQLNLRAWRVDNPNCIPQMADRSALQHPEIV